MRQPLCTSSKHISCAGHHRGIYEKKPHSLALCYVVTTLCMSTSPKCCKDNAACMCHNKYPLSCVIPCVRFLQLSFKVYHTVIITSHCLYLHQVEMYFLETQCYEHFLISKCALHLLISYRRIYNIICFLLHILQMLWTK